MPTGITYAFLARAHMQWLETELAKRNGSVAVMRPQLSPSLAQQVADAVFGKKGP